MVGLQHEIEVFERLKGVRVVDRVDLRLDEFFGLALFTLCLSAFASVFAFLLLFGIDAFDRGLLRLGRHARVNRNRIMVFYFFRLSLQLLQESVQRGRFDAYRADCVYIETFSALSLLCRSEK